MQDHVLDVPRWFDPGLDGVGIREDSFLASPRVPASVRRSVVRVSLAKGLTASEVRRQLAPHAGAAVIELSDAVDTFCGFDDDPALDRHFAKQLASLLHYRRLPLCYEDGVRVPGYSQCCTPRKPGDPFFPCVQGFEPPEPLPVCGAGGNGSAATAAQGRRF